MLTMFYNVSLYSRSLITFSCSLYLSCVEILQMKLPRENLQQPMRCAVFRSI